MVFTFTLITEKKYNYNLRVIIYTLEYFTSHEGMLKRVNG
jgi:hypothetical protein